MTCLRCGYCCKKYLVPIVNDPKKGLTEGNIISHLGDGPCKHLIGDKPGKYSCALHNKRWYKKTPCASHTQFESKNSPCRIGLQVLMREGGA